MEMTHIRFALDLAERLRVEHIHEYLAGAIYPDSRYFTKIKRDETHRNGVPNLSDDKEKMSDFEKGWATHLCYDETAHPLLMDLVLGKEPIAFMDDTWLNISAAKLVEDRLSFRALGEQAKIIEEVHLPQGARAEDPADLERYVEAQKMIYREGATNAAYADTLRAFGLPDSGVARLMEIVDAIEKEPERLRRLSLIYPSVLETTLERKD